MTDTLNIRGNQLITNRSNDLSVLYLNYGKNTINEYGHLEIVENTFVIGDKSPSILAAVNVNDDSNIYTHTTTIVIASNTVATEKKERERVAYRLSGAFGDTSSLMSESVEDMYHVYGMYSKNTKGFITATGGRFNTYESYFVVDLASTG